jgi:hypothetical protein
MRIICDHCDKPINGTVKKVSGNYNLHPDCFDQFSEALGASTVRVTESSVVKLVKWKQNAIVSSFELVRA